MLVKESIKALLGRIIDELHKRREGIKDKGRRESQTKFPKCQNTSCCRSQDVMFSSQSEVRLGSPRAESSPKSQTDDESIPSSRMAKSLGILDVHAIIEDLLEDLVIKNAEIATPAFQECILKHIGAMASISAALKDEIHALGRKLESNKFEVDRCEREL